jgi:tetratricopeptide (TPR) repeat protein
MLKRMILLMCAMLIAFNPVPLRARAEDAPADSGDVALAEHFAQLAQLALATRTINDAIWAESLAELKIAARLNPNEPRYQRLLAESALQNHDAATALAALLAYSRLVPDDEGAQLQIIDMHTATMQSADERLSYFKSLVDAPKLSDAVRSYAAMRASRLLYDRLQDTDAQAMLAQSLRLNPVNVEALRMNYDRVSDDGTTYERTGALLAMLRANPAQPDVMARLAGELAAAGLPGESIAWYNWAFNAAARLNRPLDPIVLVDATSEAFIGDQYRQADAGVSGLLQMDANSVDAWYLRLLITRRAGDKDGFTKALDQATTAVLSHLYDAHRAFAGTNPSTQPSGELSVRMPDLLDDAKKIKASGKPELIQQYAGAVTDLAWLELYFAEQPAAVKPMIDALKVLLPADNVTVPRLEGWSALLSKKTDDAKLKLSAVAERDPLSMMGLIRLNAKATDPSQMTDIHAQARKLVNEYASGLLGAMVQDGLRDFGGKLVPSQDADVIHQQIEAFPRDWVTILEKPQSFYAIRAEAMKVSHAFGEPMFAQITLQNLSDYDLTIGPDGIIHQDLWFDVNLRGPATQNLPGIIFDRLTKVLVLHKGQSVSQQVRLDAGKLGAILLQNPLMSFQLYFFVVTNPTSGSGGAVIPGPGGYRQTLKRVVDRASTPIGTPQQQQKIFDQIQSGTPAEKIRLIALLRSYFAILTGEKATKPMQMMAGEFLKELRTVTEDPNPAVSGWANLVTCALRPPDQRMGIIKQMAADQHWPTRALALLATLDSLAVNEAKEVALSLQKDSEPLVKELAKAVSEDLAHPTTQPTSQPASQPTGEPAAPAATQP